MKAPEEVRGQPEFANYKDTHAVVTGGIGGGDICSDYAAFYDVEKDWWTDLPEIWETRFLHASCVLGDKVYIFGGMRAGTWEQLNSIECIDMAKVLGENDEDQYPSWTLIQLDESKVYPRLSPIFCPFGRS